jgi:predicted O-methyltransferase YrrM
MDLSATLSCLLRWRAASPIPGGLPIATSITEAEATTLRRLARGGRVIEFGAAMGYSTVVMALVAAHVTTVDPHTGIPGSLPALLHNLQAYGVRDRVTVVTATSQAFCRDACQSADADLVFIDGDHSYEAALHDLRCAASLLVAGGAIAIHDYARIGTVNRAVADWASDPPQVVDSMAVFSPTPATADLGLQMLSGYDP